LAPENPVIVGSAVTVTVFDEGSAIDLNPANPDSNSTTFTWRNSNANFIGLSARSTDYAEMDDLRITTFTRNPIVSIETTNARQVAIDFSGILQRSTNLSTWFDLEPQPVSPWIFSPFAEREFFRIKN
jgi:hypothetical protein